MKPGRPNPNHLRLQPSIVYETMEQKRRRLRPELFGDSGTSGGTAMTAPSHIPPPKGPAPRGKASAASGKGKPVPPSLALVQARSDEPICRNLRRGSASKAIDSLHRLGSAALEAVDGVRRRSPADRKYQKSIGRVREKCEKNTWYLEGTWKVL